QSSRRLQVVSRQFLILDPDQSLNPIHEWQVLQPSAKDREFKVGMGIDKTGNNRAAGISNAARSGNLRRCCDVNDPAVFDGNRAVANWRRRNRTNPIRFVDRQDGNTWDRTVNSAMASSSTR